MRSQCGGFESPSITSVTTQSTLDSAETAVVNAQAGFQAAEQNFESAKAVLEQAEANAARSDADLVRYEQLVAKEDISHQQYDQAVAAAKANRSGVVAAGASVQAAEHDAGTRSSSLKRLQTDYIDLYWVRAPRQMQPMPRRRDARHSSIRRSLNLSYCIVSFSG